MHFDKFIEIIMKNLIVSTCILLMTINLYAQKEYLKLTPIRYERHAIEIPEGKKIRIKFVDNVHKPLKGILEIDNNSLLTVGGDTIILNNIKKIFFKNSESGSKGGLLTAGGLGLTLGGAIWFSSITLSEDAIIALFQFFGGLLLVGVISYGVIFTAIGVTTLIRGKGYKIYGNHGYHLSIVIDSQKTNSLFTR
jgi:hypothetical protein